MAQNITIKNKGQARLFKNPYLEILTKTKPWVIYSIYIPLIIAMLYYSYTELKFSIQLIISVYITAFLFWTLVEYIAHRYLFHYHPKNALGKRIIYIFHENHHEYPRDTMRLFIPPLPSIILASTLFGIIALFTFFLFGTISYAYVFFAGFTSGYLAYVSMHYAIHTFAPPKPLKVLWKNHHLHHYKHPEKGFGVSSIFWDNVFGTMPNDKK